MAELTLLPEFSGYSASEYGETTLTSALAGPMGVYSKGFKEPFLVVASWVLSTVDYMAFVEFYNARVADMDSFDMNLITEDGFPTAHRVQFVDETFQLASIGEDAYTVRCSLLAKPLDKHLPPVDMSNVRMTEDDLYRITQDGFYRILE